MPCLTFKFEGQQLDPHFLAYISSILGNKQVPSVLWGDYLLTVLGIPSYIEVGAVLYLADLAKL